jgi:diguanylate cyclase (GGDEF)-like protein
VRSSQSRIQKQQQAGEEFMREQPAGRPAPPPSGLGAQLGGQRASNTGSFAAASASRTGLPAAEPPAPAVVVRELTEDEIHERALYDLKTGVWNLRYIVTRLQYELYRAQHLQRPLCVMVVALDHFATIAMEYGTADKGIPALAAALFQNIGPLDMLGRFSEQRFLVICPEVGREQIEQHANQLREACSRATITHDRTSFNLTVSMGIAVLSAGIEDAESLMAIADLGADKVSDSGGNSLCFAAELA